MCWKTKAKASQRAKTTTAENVKKCDGEEIMLVVFPPTKKLKNLNVMEYNMLSTLKYE